MPMFKDSKNVWVFILNTLVTIINGIIAYLSN